MDLEKKLEEFNKARDKNLERLKLEIFEKMDASINNRIEHYKTAPETKVLIGEVSEKLEDHITSQLKYECSTKDILDYQSVLLKEIQKTVQEMTPSYRMLKNVETTGEVLTKVGKTILTIVIFLTTIVGSLYGIKEWVRK